MLVRDAPKARPPHRRRCARHAQLSGVTRLSFLWRRVNVRSAERNGGQLGRRLPWLAALVFVAWIAGGCGGDAPSGDQGKAATSGAPANAQGREYESKDFAVPLTAAVDTRVLNAEPALDSKNLLYWDSLSSIDKKVRFLVPVEIYRSGSRVAPPKDYLRYLRGLSKRGAKFADASHMTVDGRAATLFTATSRKHLDAALGCAVAGGDIHEECFGIQPEIIERIAIIGGGRSPLLAWARIPAEAPDHAFERVFEAMLKTVRFR
jgi:hypothetical protein